MQKPDIGVELTGGCQGFATKFMDWPEELLVGGVIKNQSQVIRRCAMHVVVVVFFFSYIIESRKKQGKNFCKTYHQVNLTVLFKVLSFQLNKLK